MTMTLPIITHDTLRELAAAGAIREATVRARGAYWTLVVSYGDQQRVLAASKSRQPRRWSRLNSLVRYLRGVGIDRFVTDASDYDPSRTDRQRPDRAAALREAHEAAAHDRWFRQQVQQALDDPQSPVPHEELKDRMAAWLTERFGPRPKR